MAQALARGSLRIGMVHIPVMVPLAALAGEAASIDIVDLFAQHQVEPTGFETPCPLAPYPEGREDYVLLCEALRVSGQLGIARVQMGGRSYLGVVVPVGDTLLLELRFDCDDLDTPDPAHLERGARGLGHGVAGVQPEA